MPKLIPKYLRGTPGGWMNTVLSSILNESPFLYNYLSNIGIGSNPNNNTYASTVATPVSIKNNFPATYTDNSYSDLEVDRLNQLIGESEHKSDVKSAIGSSGILSSDFTIGPFSKNGTNGTNGVNFKNQVMGTAVNYLGLQLGSQIGGKYGDEIGSIGSVVGLHLLTNGNLKGLFSGSSGSALGGIGYGIANKMMGGDKNKDFGSRMLTNFGGLAWSVSPWLGAAVTAGMIVNNATGKSTDKFQGRSIQSQEVLSALGGSYGGSMYDLLKAGEKEGNYGGLGSLTGETSRANKRVRKGNEILAKMDDIFDNRELGLIRGQYMSDINSLDYRLNTFGGYDQYGTRIGRKGMKLPSKLDINRIKSILEFKKGGQMNVIPEGALHARLHHMETGNKITRKGIPVVDKSGEQQAEIERNEIIFSLEVTNKLEELRKDGSEQAALEAGKLLVDEIFHNTDDRTGLIQEVIGSDEAKKGVFKEGGIIAEKPGFSIEAEEPEMDSDEDEPVGIEEVEYYQTGGIIAEKPDDSDDNEVEEYLKGNKIKHWEKPSNWTEEKIPYDEWIKDVNPEFLSENYDLRSAYEIYPKELLERWKWSTNQEDPNVYMNYNENGYYPYHLNSVAELPNGDYKFLKLGRIEQNPELIHELWGYKTNENGLANTHDLIYDKDRYWYRKKK